ncbi:50S rRNA methyltransferase, partial [Pseudomonadales bacterium]|nr:50S rRNA methyltransferase [Pseudomonadales bacterium]
MTEKLLSAPSGEWILSRFPQRQKELLRAWDAADEYVLQHLYERPPAPGRLLIANDSFGALCVALNQLAPVNWSDSWLGHEGLRANLATNQLSKAQVMS